MLITLLLAPSVAFAMSDGAAADFVATSFGVIVVVALLIGTAVSAVYKETQKQDCPFCKERIFKAATVCPHCQKTLPQKQDCPFCKQSISKAEPVCPNCLKAI